MNYEAIQIVEQRIHRHEVKNKTLKEMLNKTEEPNEKAVIRNERSIEDAVITELEDLRREMMQN